MITPRRSRLTAPKAPVQLRFLRDPPRIEKPKRIHPRHLLPLIREGLERGVHSTTRESARFQMRPLAATDVVGISVNTELTDPATHRTASNVGEPSCAINGDVVLYTGNWYAALSVDGGATFQFMDPETAFPNPSPGVRFCCDQVAQYIPQIDMFAWLLQYGPDTGDNIQRIAFASTDDAKNGRWRPFDITTNILNVPGAFLDFPDLAVGANHLYMTTNIFAPENKVGSAVVRIALDGIRSGNPIAEPFVSMDLQSFRVAQNCAGTAYFAAHADTSTLAVFSWAENAVRPTRRDVAVARWIGANGYPSRTPDGHRWLDRADPRITGATLAGNELWFAWSVDKGSNRRARPFVQIARIGIANFRTLEDINIFDPESATCYAALATNANGEVGISYMLGGGSRFPSHFVGVLTGTRSDVLVSAGERAPIDPDGRGEWGDYLAVRPVYPDRKLFAASGFTMKGPGDGSNRDVTPRFVVFGRTSDIEGSAVTVPPPVAPTVPPVSPPDDLTTPFNDVNALPVVPPQVAVMVKAACMAEGQKESPADADMVTALRLVTKPGVERWSVKTGADRDVPLVGKNVIGGEKLPTGIVEATVEELGLIDRPPDMRPPTKNFSKYANRRRGPVEFTVWQIECDIIGVKLEADGDYHLRDAGRLEPNDGGRGADAARAFHRCHVPVDREHQGRPRGGRIQAHLDVVATRLHPDERSSGAPRGASSEPRFSRSQWRTCRRPSWPQTTPTCQPSRPR